MGSYRRAARRARGAADGVDGAVATAGPVRVAHALGEDAEAGEGPVESDRILGVDLRKPPGRLACRAEVGRRTGREAEVPGDPVDVGVHREEEARGGEAVSLPEAEIDVAGPHHPAQEEMGPLARSPFGGGGEKETESPWQRVRRRARPFPEHREESLERRDVVGLPAVPGGEEGFRGSPRFGASRRQPRRNGLRDPASTHLWTKASRPAPSPPCFGRVAAGAVRGRRRAARGRRSSKRLVRTRSTRRGTRPPLDRPDDRNGVEREADRSRDASRARLLRGRTGATPAPKRPGA